MTSCPTKGLFQSRETGIISGDPEKDDGCGWCIESCPYRAIQFQEDIGAIAICDLCDGKPECKGICPTETIEFPTSDEENHTKWAGARKN
ncbi:MAG: 4Fe-4S binding protein [Desulfobacterales bacterium]|nr:4Fe-4S binding protein [Desulfobacterales bacterium]